MTRWLLTAALAAAACLSAPSRVMAQPVAPALKPISAPEAAAPFTPAQRAEIVDVVRAALKADPSILRDAIGALQAEEGLRHDAAARVAVMGAAPALAGTQGDQIAGDPSGDVSVVEFYDVRCPYCRRMLPVIADLLRDDTRIRWVYKEIPILGPASLLGARAVLAAQRQGKYAALHDALMTGNPDITPQALRTAADKAGLDWDRLQRDMDDPAIKARLDFNLELARKLGIDGTPAYVVGGNILPGAMDEATLEQAVVAARGR